MKPLPPDPAAVLRDLFHSVPFTQDFKITSETPRTLRAEFTLNSGESISIAAHLLTTAYPKTVASLVPFFDADYSIVMAPYISEASAKLCRDAGMGYIDYSGNCLITFQTIYISNHGNPKLIHEKRRSKSVFEPSAHVSSRILRTLLQDVSRVWRVQDLAKEVGCSIGMVSHVKTFLCEQNWAVQDRNGLRLTDPKSLLEAWSKHYSVERTIPCYTLDTMPVFEVKCSQAYQEGIPLCLTGFSGGVRYAPVVRYHKAHVWIHSKDVPAFFQKTGCKEVDSGSNVVLYLAPGDEIFRDSREIQESRVASPVQVYLDCMQLEGRGEEMAEAVFAKAIQRRSEIQA